MYLGNRPVYKINSPKLANKKEIEKSNVDPNTLKRREQRKKFKEKGMELARTENIRDLRFDF